MTGELTSCCVCVRARARACVCVCVAMVGQLQLVQPTHHAPPPPRLGHRLGPGRPPLLRARAACDGPGAVGTHLGLSYRLCTF